jgi:hypothetical protein
MAAGLKFDILTPWKWHRRAETCSSSEGPYFLEVFVTCTWSWFYKWIFNKTHGMNNFRIFFCFNAASGSFHEDQRPFYFCRRHTFAIRALLCKTKYFVLYTLQWHVVLQHTHRMHCCVSTATKVTRTRHSFKLYVCCLSC